MLVKEIDHIDLQTLERSLSNLLDVFRPAIEGGPLPPVIEICFPPELRRDHHAAPKWSKCLTYEFFVRERAAHFRRIEERYPSLHGGTDHSDHLRFVFRRPI